VNQHQHLLSVRGVARRLPSGGRMLTILEGIDLDIAQGESVAVLGPSGSGKSTLLALMAGLDRPSEGEIRIRGERIDQLSEDRLAVLRRETVGFVFQSFQLLANLTALENVLLPLDLLGASGARRRAAAAAGFGGTRRARPPLPIPALRW
jgi:putative ABC transport system ATP-binding protein